MRFGVMPLACMSSTMPGARSMRPHLAHASSRVLYVTTESSTSKLSISSYTVQTRWIFFSRVKPLRTEQKMTALSASRQPSSSRIWWMRSYAPSVSPLLTTASTMQPRVMLVGRMWRLRISVQHRHTPLMSFACPYALIRLPKVWEPFTAKPSVLRNCFNFSASRSGLPILTQASTTDDSKTSSMGSSMSVMRSIVSTISASFDQAFKLFSKIEQVTWLGFTPAAFISRTILQISARCAADEPRATRPLTSSLNVTRFGCKPAARISSISERAFLKLSPWRWALIRVLYDTTSAKPSFLVSSIQASAARKSRHSTQASSTVL
mmetsp:Transcript_71290/g.199945  ORF Transcript_71290/g.199945 Transcript_71290/m.199945 type:complete len:322 (-) Transcript_71290:770-1735(-)